MDSYRHELAEDSEPCAALRECQGGGPVALLHSCGQGPAFLLTEPVAELTLAASAWQGAFDRLHEFLAVHAQCRVAGWLGYDLRDDVEALPRTIREDFAVPVLHVAAYARCREWTTTRVPPDAAALPVPALRVHTSRADYERRVAALVEHICAGDIFQANLTQPFSADYSGDPRALFQRLCHTSPAPFAAYLEDGHGTCVLSSSPEEFLYRDGLEVRTRPIKGTRPRAPTPAQDAGLLRELLASDKDLAELTMIVDLLRNDLGKVAQVGSVAVGSFPEHASYAQVHHLFATVRARLRPALPAVELLRATFPGGSITGAPKLRAMELLEAHELVRRGAYTGAIGWFGPGSRMHLSIAIRTLTLAHGRLRANAGGGITAESDPAGEYEETIHKIAGIARALGAIGADGGVRLVEPNG